MSMLRNPRGGIQKVNRRLLEGSKNSTCANVFMKLRKRSYQPHMVGFKTSFSCFSLCLYIFEVYYWKLYHLRRRLGKGSRFRCSFLEQSIIMVGISFEYQCNYLIYIQPPGGPINIIIIIISGYWQNLLQNPTPCPTNQRHHLQNQLTNWKSHSIPMHSPRRNIYYLRITSVLYIRNHHRGFLEAASRTSFAALLCAQRSKKLMGNPNDLDLITNVTE